MQSPHAKQAECHDGCYDLSPVECSPEERETDGQLYAGVEV